MSKQVSQYDKIFKENIEAAIPGLMAHLLGIVAVSSEELPDDIQHTKERKPDVLKKITDDHGHTFVLQLEFQLIDEPDMVFRMAEYYIMLSRKYKLPVRQYVLFLGSVAPKMATQFQSDRLQYTFPVVSFVELDYALFLKAENPEEVLLSVLADFGGERPEQVLSQVIHRIEETAVGDLALRRYLNQLRVLAQLRNLEEILSTLSMDSLANFVRVERDAFYLLAQQQEQTKFVSNLLTQTNHAPEQIASLAGVSLAFVKAIQQRLAPNTSQG